MLECCDFEWSQALSVKCKTGKFKTPRDHKVRLKDWAARVPKTIAKKVKDQRQKRKRKSPRKGKVVATRVFFSDAPSGASRLEASGYHLFPWKQTAVALRQSPTDHWNFFARKQTFSIIFVQCLAGWLCVFRIHRELTKMIKNTKTKKIAYTTRFFCIKSICHWFIEPLVRVPLCVCGVCPCVCEYWWIQSTEHGEKRKKAAKRHWCQSPVHLLLLFASDQNIMK